MKNKRPKGLNRNDFDTWFWNQTRQQPNGCIEWTKGVDNNGYGKAMFEGRYFRCHRIAYLLKRGEIPPGMLVMHTCDNPPCCNPDHLKIGTAHENRMDAAIKGRLIGVGRKPGFVGLRGDHHPHASVTDAIARRIRNRFLNGERVIDIVNSFGLKYITVYQIAHGINFKYLD